MESGILLPCSVYRSVGIVAIACDRHFIFLGDRSSDVAVRDCDRFLEVIAVAGDVLFPDNDGIVGKSRLSPLGIDDRGLFKPGSEGERRIVQIDNDSLVSFFIRYGSLRSGIPVNKGKAATEGILRSFGLGDVFAVQELRGGIGCTAAVSAEDQPVSGRRVNAQIDAAGKQEFRLVRISGLFIDRASVLKLGIRCRGYEPPLKVLIGAANGIVIVCRISNALDVGLDQLGIGEQNCALLVMIGNDDRLEQRGIIVHLIAVGNARIKLCFHFGTDLVDRKHGRLGRIVLVRSPSVEREAAGIAHAGIIKNGSDLLIISVGIVLALDVDRYYVPAVLVEVDLHTRVFTGLDHDVYGEVLCREADSIIVGGYGLHKLAAAAALVIDLQRLSIAERIIRDGDRDRFLRLPALTVLIENGDIVGSEHLLIGRGGAGGALGGSSTIDALENHLRLGCALLDRSHAAAYRQKAVNTDIAGGQSLLFGLDGLLGGGLFSRGCRDLDQTDTGGRIAHRNRREIVFAGDDLQLAALHTAVQRDESKRLALFKRRHRLDADSQLEILAVAADRPAFKNGTSLDGSDGNALQLGRVLIGGIAALCHSDGIFALALVAVRYVDGLFALDDGLFGGLGILRELGRLGILRELGRLGLIRLFSRLRILRKLDHIIILVSAVVQAGGQGLIAGPQYHQQGKQKREYALRQFVHLMRASYSYTWRRIAPPRFIYCVMGFAGAVSLGFAVYIEVAMLFAIGLGLRFAGDVFRSFAYFSLFSSACALE